jgi:hypothetical protein
MVLGKLAISMHNTETGTLSSNLYKNQYSMNQILNVRPSIMKLLSENIGKALENVGIGNYFLNRFPIVQE